MIRDPHDPRQGAITPPGLTTTRSDDSVFAAVEELGPTDVAAVAAHLGQSVTTVSEALLRLRASGRLLSSGGGTSWRAAR